jgi:hypothetical protein
MSFYREAELHGARLLLVMHGHLRVSQLPEVLARVAVRENTPGEYPPEFVDPPPGPVGCRAI